MTTEMNRMGQPIDADIPGWTPPPFPDRAPMQGRFCRLESLVVERHAEDLWAANQLDNEGANWTYLPYGPFDDFAKFRNWLAQTCTGDDPLFFAIRELACDEVVGVASYLRITPASGSIEVGHLNFSPKLQGTTAATEAMYLMMERAFDLGYRRYEWKCHAMNAPSRAAAERLGLTFEGVFRQHTVVKGRNRDSAWYAAFDSEWPALREAFQTWLSPDNFDASGQQRTRLSKLTSTQIDGNNRDESKIKMLGDASRRAQAYCQSADAAPIYPSQNAIDALQQFDAVLPDGPTDADAVLAQLDEIGSAATVRSTKGRYFGFVNGNSEPVATAAAVLLAAWDQNVGMPVMSPVGAHLDAIASRWVCELLGLPASATAAFCSGASVANLTCIIAARDELLRHAGWDVHTQGINGAPPIRVVASEEAHISVLRSLRHAGIGTNAIQTVETDRFGRVKASAFPETDDLTLTLLQAGNVNTGYSDPFDEIIPRVRSSGGWIHVDGAFGLWAAASPQQTKQVAGVQQADSWATDAHKWLNAPYDSGIAICARKEDLQRAMAADAAYLMTDSDRVPMQLGLQMSQRARAVETWAIIASKGKEGIARMVDHLCEMATRMATRLTDGGANQRVSGGLNQLLFSFGSQEETDRVIAAVQQDRTCWVGGTTWQGHRAMRISLSDSSTTAHDVDECTAAILRCWKQVAP